MPRPKRPQYARFTLPLDRRTLAKLAALDDPDDKPKFSRLMADVRTLVNDQCREWQPNAGPGHRDRATRNALVLDLARAFRCRCGWRHLSDESTREYRRAMLGFVACILASADISYGADRLYRLLRHGDVAQPRS